MFNYHGNSRVLVQFWAVVEAKRSENIFFSQGPRDPETGSWPIDMTLVDATTKTKVRVSEELARLNLARFVV